MLTTAVGLPTMPTIASVYGPIEAQLGPLSGDGPELPLEPLDAYLLHRVLDLLPVETAVIDLAARATGGASTLLLSAHPCVGRAIETPNWRSIESEYGNSPVFVALVPNDSQTCDAVQRCLNAVPAVLVMVLGIGQVGGCSALADLIALVRGNSGFQLSLMREWSAVLSTSRLAMVARENNPAVAQVRRRVGQSFTSNFNYLDLVTRVCDEALRVADENNAAMKAHPTGWLAENREANARLARASEELAGVRTELEGVYRQLGEANRRVEELYGVIGARDQEIISLRSGWAARASRLMGRARRVFSQSR